MSDLRTRRRRFAPTAPERRVSVDTDLATLRRALADYVPGVAYDGEAGAMLALERLTERLDGLEDVLRQIDRECGAAHRLEYRLRNIRQLARAALAEPEPVVGSTS